MFGLKFVFHLTSRQSDSANPLRSRPSVKVQGMGVKQSVNSRKCYWTIVEVVAGQ